MTRIFISHSHSDEAIAFKLVDFLLEALGLNSREILCTSNPDQGLSFSSSSITDQLKEALKKSEALIVLITADSLHSAWIPFEAGSFWTTDKPIIPILGPGLTQHDLPGPLKNFLSIPIEVQDVEDRLNNATNQIAEKLNLQQTFTRRRNIKLREFSDALRAWQSQRPVMDPAQQKQIEELTQKLEDKEEFEQSLQLQIKQLEQQLEQARSHNQQLQEMKAASQKEKEELERNYQNQKQKLEQSLQSLQSQIRQLEQQLEQARSQVEQLEERSPTASQAQSFTEDLGNGIRLDMIYISGGTFMMGSPEGDGEEREKHNMR